LKDFPVKMPGTRKKDRGETLLVVQDSASLRARTARLLEAAGYRVYLATSGNEALDIWKVVSTEIALLVVDVRMPCISGVELAQVLRALRPGLKVLLTGGSTKSSLKSSPNPDHWRHLLKKPFRKQALLQAVRKALDDRG
jgi:two-component system cell cycle sensor histidine kinase/response regulator CckA